MKEAGLDRVTLSLDSVDRDNFAEITGVDGLDHVLEAINVSKELGFEPLKINAVIVRGRNDHEVVELARFARENAVNLRFIEYMPLDSGHSWDRGEVVSGKEIREMIDAEFPLVLKDKTRGSETAWNFSFADNSPGEIGIIAPVTEMFCGACSRIRLLSDGQIRTCLFSTVEYDLRGVLRSGAGDYEVSNFIRSAVLNQEPRHYINDAEFTPASRTMSFIGAMLAAILRIPPHRPAQIAVDHISISNLLRSDSL